MGFELASALPSLQLQAGVLAEEGKASAEASAGRMGSLVPVLARSW